MNKAQAKLEISYLLQHQEFWRERERQGTWLQFAAQETAVKVGECRSLIAIFIGASSPSPLRQTRGGSNGQ